MSYPRRLEQEYQAARFAEYSNAVLSERESLDELLARADKNLYEASVPDATEWSALQSLENRTRAFAHCQVLPTDRRTPGAYSRSH
jgi:hypothetical protein